MVLVFKYVTGNEDTGPLGLLTKVENNRYPNLMIGTDCENPATLDEDANWHFRVENVPASYIANNIYPRQIDGPVPDTYGTWIHTDHIPCREDCACNELGNWPLYFVPTDNQDGTYTWDIFIVPYLGGSVIAGIEPKLPKQGKQFSLEVYDADNEQTYTILASEDIPDLSSIFGEDGDPDFYPALFGFNYRQALPPGVYDPDEDGLHNGVDIVPLGLFSGGVPDDDWDENNPQFKKVYAVVGGSVLLDPIENEDNVTDVIILTDDSDPHYPSMQFIYSHIVPKSGLGSTVSAGDEIGTILNHQYDSRSHLRTHLHFEVKTRLTDIRLVDPRQFIYPGLTPNP